MTFLRVFVIALGGLAAAAVLGLGLLFHLFDRPGPLAGPAIVVVPKGAGVAEIARLLERQGVLQSAFVFQSGVRLTGSTGQLRAGEYEFPGHASARAVMDVLKSGKTYVRRLTLPEGRTSAQAMELVTVAYGLDGSVGPIPGEGELLPDTYHYSYGDSRAALVARMQEAMVETVAELWPARADGLPLDTAAEAVVLASIVERETGVPAERARIAGVFYNRLRRGMPLQSDPTVAYGIALEQGLAGRVLDRPLTRKDLKTPGPYNTYLNQGLPPGPIANPGRAALEAVLHPAETDALYFVANGDGGHLFARTLEEHNRNVRRWRQIRDAARNGAGKGPPPAP